MLRREVVKMAGSLFGLGAGTPTRFPYPDRPQPAPGIGPSQGQVVRARQVIVFGPGSGVFLYSPSPGAGNLVASIAAQAGTDPYGNAYGAGFTSFGPLGAAAQITSAVIGLFSGLNVIVELTAQGMFLYSPSGGAGNLVASVTPAAGTDSFGNAFRAGVTVYGTGGGTSFVEMLAGVPALVNVGTGDAAEATPAQLNARVVGAGPTRYILSDLRAPRVTGEAALAIGEIQLFSPTADLSVPPGVNIIANDGTSQAFVQVKPSGTTILQGPLTSTQGTAAAPTLITTDVFNAVTLTTPANWTVNNTLEVRLEADGWVGIDGELTAAAAIATGAQLATLAAAYRPANRSVRLTFNANTGTASVGAVLGNLTTGGVLTTFPAIASGTTLNICARYPLGA